MDRDFCVDEIDGTSLMSAIGESSKSHTKAASPPGDEWQPTLSVSTTLLDGSVHRASRRIFVVALTRKPFNTLQAFASRSVRCSPSTEHQRERSGLRISR